ncbi:MAG TPA: hypothetical protein VFA16_19125 [Mycobacterium sp.]|uniref:hypothetical protein n=1 Tax=Mycobacterium sp. TaxID=1785 RepID=UPI002D49B410|nr:hypothetical protein [Mycobacterium sp.]HZU49342.1 hypothetical protein [Mycobacterium sp.]
MRAATEALAAVSLPDQAVVLASWGLVGGLGILGRTDQIGAAVERGYAAAAAGFDAPVLRLGLGYRHLLGLRLAGHLDEAEHVAVQAHREVADAPGWFPLAGLVLLGQAVAARDLGSALRWLREARAGLQAFGDVGGWLFRCLLGLTQTLAMTGHTAAAKQILAELEGMRHPGFVFLEPELILVRAWVAAAEGAVSSALALSRQAATVAAEAGQVAHEVLALQTVASFGDPSPAGRLATLAIEVIGPRSAVAARFAEALAPAMALNCSMYQRNSNAWVIWWRQWTRPRTRPSPIVRGVGAGRRLAVLRAPMHWLNNAAAQARRRFGGPRNRCR